MNKATAPLRVGLIGAGHISADYLRAARFFGQIKVAVCADLNAAAAEARAREFNIEFASIEALLDDDSIELVLNLTTPQAHVPVALRAVEAGKHTYCEKPLGLSVSEAEPLLKAARSRGMRIGCAPDTFFWGGSTDCQAFNRQRGNRNSGRRNGIHPLAWSRALAPQSRLLLPTRRRTSF